MRAAEPRTYWARTASGRCEAVVCRWGRNVDVAEISDRMTAPTHSAISCPFTYLMWYRPTEKHSRNMKIWFDWRSMTESENAPSTVSTEGDSKLNLWSLFEFNKFVACVNGNDCVENSFQSSYAQPHTRWPAHKAHASCTSGFAFLVRVLKYTKHKRKQIPYNRIDAVSILLRFLWPVNSKGKCPSTLTRSTRKTRTRQRGAKRHGENKRLSIC